MLTTTISDFRKDIKKYLDKVTHNFETLIINRGKDNGVVIMSLAEYNSLVATQHELSSRENEKRLDAAIEESKKENFSFKESRKLLSGYKGSLNEAVIEERREGL
jgi:antitoxin YefM